MTREKVKAPVMVAPHTIEYWEFELPEIGPRDTLLRMRLCGVCGSDVHLYHGESDSPYPRIQGHEIFGKVVEIGAEASKKHGVQAGDLVNVELLIPCWECYYCQRGDYARCVKGDIFGIIPTSRPPGLWGGFGGYLYVPYNARFHKFSKDTIPEAAVLTEPLATAVRACKRSEVSVGTSVVIIGPGPIGLVSVVAAKAFGAELIVLVGTREDRLALGKELGADYTIKVTRDTPREEVAEQVREAINEQGLLAEIVLEAAGTVSGQKMGLGLLRPTGLLTIMGVIGGGEVLEVDTFNEILLYENRVIASHLSGWGYEPAVSIINSRRFPLEKIVTHSFSNSELEKAFHYTEHRKENAIKVTVHP